MPRTDRDQFLVPSLLDRLLDDEPKMPHETAPHRSQNLRQLKASVARDLEALLNTRRETLEELSSDFEEVTRSLVTYGLPDLTSFSLIAAKDRSRIQRVLEETIATFEPRLARVRAALQPPREHDKAVRFRVDAMLRVEPSPEPVTFDTVLQLNTQEYTVQGQD